VSNTLAMTSFYNSGKTSKVVFVITKLIKEMISILVINGLLPQWVHDE
jgi:hypothetical protein